MLLNDFFSSKLKKILALHVVISLSGLGCGEKTTKIDPKEAPSRGGSQVESTSFQYFDSEPVISATGDRFLYISGRESSSTSINLKAYRVEWPLNESPKTPTRLTGEELGQEQEVALSPSGQYAVVAVLKNSQKNLYIQTIVPLGVSLPPSIPLSSGKEQETIGAFSPDSKYFAWISRLGMKSQVRMVSVSEFIKSPTDWSLQYNVGTEFLGEGRLAWIPTDDGLTYRIFLAKSKIGGLFTFEEAQFTSPTQISVKSVNLPVPYDAGIILKKNIKLSATKRYLFMIQDLAGTSQEAVERIGDASVAQGESKEKTAILSRALAFDHSDYSMLPMQGPGQDPLGIDTLGMSWSQKGQFGLMLTRSFFRCQEDPKPAFGTGILWTDTAEISAKIPPKIVRKTVRFMGIEGQEVKSKGPTDPDESKLPESWLFGFKEGFCQRKIEGGLFQRIDNQINHLTINDLAVSDEFRLVYVSRFVPRVDSKCELKSGDLEVRAMEWKNNEAVFHALTPNRALIKNASSQDGACAVYW